MNDYTKHTPHTDALDTLGSLIGPNEHRDAIHLAVEPVIAAESFYAGAHVGLNADGKASAAVDVKRLGIVDPFLKDKVMRGDRFWLVVYPREIRSLRHVWEHPDFPSSGVQAAQDTKEAALVIIRNIADSLGVGADELIQRAQYYVNDGEYWDQGDRFDGESIPHEFWSAFEAYTGQIVPEGEKYSFLSCSC